MKKATVLKSLRTISGAKDWIKVFGKNYDGELKVVDTETLKSYEEFDGYLDSYPLTNHVVIEEDLTPIVSVIKEGEIGELVKAFVSKGFMEVGAHGPCFTDKWYSAIDKYVAGALAEAFKSTSSEYKYEFSGEVDDVAGDFLRSVGKILKAVEDAEALAASGEATENADFGHELRANKPISDSEVKSAEAKTASQAGGDADTSDSKLNGEAVSDAEVKTATHEGNHNTVKKSSHGKEPNAVTQEDVQGTDEPEEVDDEAAGKAVAKKAGTKKSADGEFEPELEEVVNTVFKSLSEAKGWKNPDRNRYHVVPTSFEDKKKYGRNKNYIVKEKAPQPLIGSFGNKR